MRARSCGFVYLAPLVGALHGCSSGSPGSESPPVRRPLVRLEGWTAVPRAQDPFITDTKAVPSCTDPTFRVESDQAWVEIDTTLCNWVTLEQPALASVAVGDLLEVDFSHYDLDAAAPASAELALRFEDCEAWSKSIEIPSAAKVYTEQFRSPCRLASAGPVRFHLHNHGQNTYQLKSLFSLK